MPYDPPQKVQAVKKKHRRVLRPRFTAERGFHEVEVSESDCSGNEYEDENHFRVTLRRSKACGVLGDNNGDNLEFESFDDFFLRTQ